MVVRHIPKNAHLRFPNSMVDRITPATTEELHRCLRPRLNLEPPKELKTELKEKHGVEDGWPVVSCFVRKTPA